MLVKEIRSKTGELHFRRYRIFSCRLFSIFIHKIYQSDEDLHPHNHPWNFVSIILSGGYVETLYGASNAPEKVVAKPFSVLFRRYYDFHKIELVSTTTSLVFTGRRIDQWGYLVNELYYSAEEYRNLKNNSQLPS